MRPRGEVRQVLASAVTELAAVPGPDGRRGCTWRDVAARACVGWDAARKTLENMASAGEVTRIGTRPVPGSRRPMTLYAPAGAVVATQAAAAVELQAVWR